MLAANAACASVSPAGEDYSTQLMGALRTTKKNPKDAWDLSRATNFLRPSLPPLALPGRRLPGPTLFPLVQEQLP
jgi:hypothetical protein